jgi:hypothetical protein
MAQILFECLALGHVMRIDNDAVHCRIGGEVGHGEIERAPLASTARHAQLGAMRCRRIGRQTEQQCRKREAIVGMYEARQLVSDELVRFVSQYPGHRCTDVVDKAVVVDDGNHV